MNPPVKTRFDAKPEGITHQERSALWKSFWLGAVGALVANLIIFVLLAAIRDLLLIRMIVAGLPPFLIWSSLARKLEKYKEYTGISYPLTYFVIAIGCLIGIIGPLIMLISFSIRVGRIPTVETFTSDGYSQDTGLTVPVRQTSHSSLTRSKGNVMKYKEKLIEWLLLLSTKQRWILFAGFSLILVLTLIHNPLSGYDHSYDGMHYTNEPLGMTHNNSYGFLKLGLLRTYISFVAVTVIMTSAGIYITGIGDAAEKRK